MSTVQRLLQWRTHSDSVGGEDGMCALSIACQNGDSVMAGLLLEGRANPNLAHEDHGGQTPLLSAVEAGHRRIVKLLLNAGASPNVADEEGTTPLMVVEDAEIAQALLARGAQRGARNRAGRTALDVARQEGRGEIVQVLEGRVGGEAGPSTDTGGS